MCPGYVFVLGHVGLFVSAAPPRKGYMWHVKALCNCGYEQGWESTRANERASAMNPHLQVKIVAVQTREPVNYDEKDERRTLYHFAWQMSNTPLHLRGLESPV